MAEWGQSERWIEETMRSLTAGQKEQDNKLDAMEDRVLARLRELELQQIADSKRITSLSTKVALLVAGGAMLLQWAFTYFRGH